MGNQGRSFKFRRDRDLAIHASGNKSKSFDPSGMRIASMASCVERPADTFAMRHVLIFHAANMVILRGPFPFIYEVALVFQVSFK